MRPKLDKWIIYGNCLVGYLYDSLAFPSGTRVKTDAIRWVDTLNSAVSCLDGEYTLLEPGSELDHQSTLEGMVGGIKIGDFTKSKPTESKKIISI